MQTKLIFIWKAVHLASLHNEVHSNSEMADWSQDTSPVYYIPCLILLCRYFAERNICLSSQGNNFIVGFNIVTALASQ